MKSGFARKNPSVPDGTRMFSNFKLGSPEDALQVLTASLSVLGRGVVFNWRADPKVKDKHSFVYKLCEELHASRLPSSSNKIKNFFDRYGLHVFIKAIQDDPTTAVPTADELITQMESRKLLRNN